MGVPASTSYQKVIAVAAGKACRNKIMLVSNINPFQGKFCDSKIFTTLSNWRQEGSDAIRDIRSLCSAEAKAEQNELHILQII